MSLKDIFVFVFLFVSNSVYAAQDVYLGVYESKEIKNSVESSKIRLPFVWHSGKWQAMPQQVFTSEELNDLSSKYPSKITLWPLQDTSQSIDASLPSAWKSYSEVGLYYVEKLNDADLLQPIGLQEFMPWDFKFKYHPVVLTTTHAAKASTVFGAKTLRRQEKSQLLVALRKKLPHYDYCKVQEGNATKKEWKDTDVVYNKILRSGNVTLVSLKLSEKLDICGYPEGYKNDHGEITCQFCSQWFLIQDNDIKFLGAGLSYLGHGDYNADNNDEWIFYLSGYNLDGYVLFSDDFSVRVKYVWSYH